MYASNSASRSALLAPMAATVPLSAARSILVPILVFCGQDAARPVRVASRCEDGPVLGYLVPVLLLVGGAVLLTAGAEGFAEHVTGAASRLGVSVLALGLLLAGAEPEEAVTAMLASGRGHPALAAGDAIGANLVILTLTIGLAALLGRLPVTRRVVQYAVAAAVAGTVTVVLLWNGVLGRLEGALLALV